MASEEVTVEKLEELATAFRHIADEVAEAAKEMRKAKMPAAWLHAKTVIETRMPELIDWSAKTLTATKSQTVAHKLGVKNQAQIEKETNARRVAKKAAVKKGE